MRKRFVEQYGITEYDAHVLTATRSLAEQFELAAKAAKNPKRVANLVQGELMGRLKAKGLELEQSPISMKGVAMSADLVESGAITGKQLKELYDLCFDRNQDFPAVYENEKPQQITDMGAIEKAIDEVLAESPKQVEQYRAGKTTLKGFFVGQVMKKTKGQANPALVNELLDKKTILTRVLFRCRARLERRPINALLEFFIRLENRLESKRELGWAMAIADGQGASSPRPRWECNRRYPPQCGISAGELLEPLLPMAQQFRMSGAIDVVSGVNGLPDRHVDEDSGHHHRDAGR